MVKYLQCHVNHITKLCGSNKHPSFYTVVTYNICNIIRKHWS